MDRAWAGAFGAPVVVPLRGAFAEGFGEPGAIRYGLIISFTSAFARRPSM